MDFYHNMCIENDSLSALADKLHMLAKNCVTFFTSHRGHYFEPDQPHLGGEDKAVSH